ncbi:MAG: dCTP deaminase [Thermoguttaceae bacterium]|jgi:dCTP deaminase
MLKADRIADLLARHDSSDPLVITPHLPIEQIRKSGTASVDLRLGTWFLTLRQSRFPVLPMSDAGGAFPGENRLTKRHYVPFGSPFILHPRSFVLGATLEWIRLPKHIAGYVVGKSSLGRRGLVIATATGVHPGFAGCLTLEISNLGEMPIPIKPGIQVCQICLHELDTDPSSAAAAQSSFSCTRRPTLGNVTTDDDIAKKLSFPDGSVLETQPCVDAWNCPVFMPQTSKTTGP